MLSLLFIATALPLASNANLIGACQDNHNRCSLWASQGHCHPSSIYSWKTIKLCPKTCNGCTACHDYQNRCSLWASKGYCHPSSIQYRGITKFCPKTCNVCTARPKASISNPCQLVDPEGPLELLPLPQEIQTTLHVLNRLSASVDATLEAFVEPESLMTSEMRTALMNNPFAKLPGLPIPTGEGRTFTSENIVSELTKDHRDAMTYAVFAETIYNEEDGSEILKAELLKFKDNMFDSLCRLDVLLKFHKSPPKDFVTSDVMPDFIKKPKFTGEMKRYQRAFLMMKASRRFVDYLKRDYLSFHETVSTSS